MALAVLVAVAGWGVRHRLRHKPRSGVTDEIALLKNERRAGPGAVGGDAGQTALMRPRGRGWRYRRRAGQTAMPASAADGPGCKRKPRVLARTNSLRELSGRRIVQSIIGGIE